MNQSIFRKFQLTLSLLTLTAFASLQPACSSLSSSQRGALLVGAASLANIAANAAATGYGNSAAGSLASAGLSALASVLQGYVGAKIPPAIVQATPGVANVGAAVAGVITPTQTVTQTDVNTVNQAAALAATLPIPTPSTPTSN